MTLDEIIESENECTYVDFKTACYTTDQHSSLLKDVLSMANADVIGPRYIIIGVQFKDGERQLLGIEGSVTDEASYQELIHANITPELYVTYTPFVHDEKTFWVFTIDGCDK